MAPLAPRARPRPAARGRSGYNAAMPIRYTPSELDQPSLSEADGIRYLHFGTEWVQGAMLIRDPARLVLEYTAQMMAWLLFSSRRANNPSACSAWARGRWRGSASSTRAAR